MGLCLSTYIALSNKDHRRWSEKSPTDGTKKRKKKVKKLEENTDLKSVMETTKPGTPPQSNLLFRPLRKSQYVILCPVFKWLQIVRMSNVVVFEWLNQF